MCRGLSIHIFCVSCLFWLYSWACSTQTRRNRKRSDWIIPYERPHHIHKHKLACVSLFVHVCAFLLFLLLLIVCVYVFWLCEWVKCTQTPTHEQTIESDCMFCWNNQHKVVCERIVGVSAKYGARRKYEIDEKWLCVQKYITNAVTPTILHLKRAKTRKTATTTKNTKFCILLLAFFCCKLLRLRIKVTKQCLSREKIKKSNPFKCADRTGFTQKQQQRHKSSI